MAVDRSPPRKTNRADNANTGTKPKASFERTYKLQECKNANQKVKIVDGDDCLCGKCNLNVGDGDQGIQCDYCQV